VGDFNRDGNPDLAVANFWSDSVSILTGAGDGTFNAAVNYPAGTKPWSVAVGDFNVDGKPDLAVANNGSNNVSILTGAGDGTFNAAVDYAVETWPYSVAVGDFNRDGNPDLAVANYGSHNVSVLLNGSNLTITEVWDLPYGLDEDPMAINMYMYPSDATQVTLADITAPDELVVVWYYGGPGVGWKWFKPGWPESTLATLVPGKYYIGIALTATEWEIPQ
jgi:hypothetical protein